MRAPRRVALAHTGAYIGVDESDATPPDVADGGVAASPTVEVRMPLAGDRIDLPPNVPHLHPWNVGDDVLVMRQVATLDPPVPVQRARFGLLSLVRRSAGLRPYYDRFLTPLRPDDRAGTAPGAAGPAAPRAA